MADRYWGSYALLMRLLFSSPLRTTHPMRASEWLPVTGRTGRLSDSQNLSHVFHFDVCDIIVRLLQAFQEG